MAGSGYSQYVESCTVDQNAIHLALTDSGFDYGNTDSGAHDLAVYAVSQYYAKYHVNFPRSIDGWWNGVSHEIKDHCWLEVSSRGKPWYSLVHPHTAVIDIGINDCWPTWRD